MRPPPREEGRIIIQFIRHRNMSIKSLQGRQTTDAAGIKSVSIQ